MRTAGAPDVQLCNILQGLLLLTFSRHVDPEQSAPPGEESHCEVSRSRFVPSFGKKITACMVFFAALILCTIHSTEKLRHSAGAVTVCSGLCWMTPTPSDRKLAPMYMQPKMTAKKRIFESCTGPNL